MSNALAIASVSALLRDLLNNGLVDASVGDVTVSVQPPDRISTENGEAPQVNLFLFRVSPNQGWRNVGLPAVDGSGTRVLDNPPLALDLHYLLSAYGAGDFQREILLGYAMQVLHETPVLSRQSIRDTFTPGPVTGSILPPPLQSLVAAELADQVEQIKIVPETLTTEEISRLWSAFGAHYRPTAAYQASVVLIESKRTTSPALPVRLRQVFVVPWEEPTIERVEAASSPDDPILEGVDLALVGRRLFHVPLEAAIDGAAATLVDASDTRIVATPPAGLRAGVHAAQVKHMLDFGTPKEPHRGLESNVVAFVLRPEFGGLTLAPVPAGATPYSGKATVTVTPQVGRSQRVVLLLNGTSPAAPNAYAFLADRRAADGDPIVVPVEEVVRGDYFVRVQVDGAQSPLDLDPSSVAFGPKVTV